MSSGLHSDSVAVSNVSKSFGHVRALIDVDVRIERGTLAALLGPSGCGKTTLLRTIAGFETPDRGTIMLDGVDVTTRPLGARNVGFVFQNYALFPHLSVEQNVGFALEVRKVPRTQVRAQVAELLDLVELSEYGKRRPHQLSGGQRQRVALARALAAKPATLLLDEPFAALDMRVRKELRRSLRALHERTGVTTILVTHDSDEALEIADTVVVMRDGCVQQQATARDIYAEPANAFVMQCFGDVNAIAMPDATHYVRPGDYRIERAPFEGGSSAAIESISEVGPRAHLTLRLDDGQRVAAELDRLAAARLAASPGTHVYLEATRVHAFETVAR